jgi:hypothetical protein
MPSFFVESPPHFQPCAGSPETSRDLLQLPATLYENVKRSISCQCLLNVDLDEPNPGAIHSLRGRRGGVHVECILATRVGESSVAPCGVGCAAQIDAILRLSIHDKLIGHYWTGELAVEHE